MSGFSANYVNNKTAQLMEHLIKNSPDEGVFVTILGSSKFVREIDRLKHELSSFGFMVLDNVVRTHHMGIQLTDEQIAVYEMIMQQKIYHSSAVFVVCPNEYIGDATLEGIKLADFMHKPIITDNRAPVVDVIPIEERQNGKAQS